MLEFKKCKFKALKVLENEDGPWNVLEDDLLFLEYFLFIESLIELFAMLLRILVTILLWKDFLLRNALDGIFSYSVKYGNDFVAL